MIIFHFNNQLFGIFFKFDWKRIEKDYNKAKEYYEKSAELGNSSALNYLGNSYENGFETLHSLLNLKIPEIIRIQRKENRKPIKIHWILLNFQK